MTIAVYHRVMRREGFEVTAKILVEMTRNTQIDHPGEPRVLYLDIDGHRNADGAFDADMIELQKMFVLEFLLPYYTEVHTPIVSARNSHGQDDDVPDKFFIANLEEKEDVELTSLYVENHSNTEFVSEEPVRHYLEHVSDLLREVRLARPVRVLEEDAVKGLEWRCYWRGYVIDLITELFNSFVFGNLISVTAMTRSLIESCAYMMLFERYRSSDLALRWLLCSGIRVTREMDNDSRDAFLELVRKCCVGAELEPEEIIKRFSKGGENDWLFELIPKKRITFRDVCDHLEDADLYDDFRYVCSFVHGQDLITKMSPFTFF